MVLFRIEDEAHAEPQGDFASFEAALAELRRREVIPWNEEPNRAPCGNWQECGRRYEIIEYSSTVPMLEVTRRLVLEVSSAGAKWQPIDC